MMPQFKKDTFYIDPPIKGYPKITANLLSNGSREDAIGIIVIAGATAVPPSYYDRVGDFFSKKQFIVITFTYSGMGCLNKESCSDVGLEDWVRVDIPSVLSWIEEHFPCKPIHYVGHSYGGQVLGLFSYPENLSTLTTVAASSGYWLQTKSWLKNGFLLKIVMPFMTAVFGYCPLQLMQFGMNVTQKTSRDWTRWCSQKGYIHNQKSLGVISRTEYPIVVKYPLLRIVSPNDDYATPKNCADLWRYYDLLNVVDYQTLPNEKGEYPNHYNFFHPKFSSDWNVMLDFFLLHQSKRNSSTNQT